MNYHLKKMFLNLIFVSLKADLILLHYFVSKFVISLLLSKYSRNVKYDIYYFVNNSHIRSIMPVSETNHFKRI